ncbi:hypothetical protein TNCV_1538721 [Trichonephila clavipes]|nr:hypothetical protein TNCV_1538721 [Trichonephila clavipes]
MVELDWSPELRQVDTSRQKPLRCKPVPVFLMWKPRLETLELPDVLTSDGELQQPGPRRSRCGRLLKPRKGLNDSWCVFYFKNSKLNVGSVTNVANELVVN